MVKVIPLLCILTSAILISGCTGAQSPSPITVNNTGVNAFNKSFNDIADSLNILQNGAVYVRYSDMKDDPQLGQFLTTYYWSTLPSPQLFGASALRDTLVVYPTYWFGDITLPGGGSVVSLTDFGNATLNQSYPQVYTTLKGNRIPLREIYSNYYFSPNTSPVVSGTQNATVGTLYSMAGVTLFKTAYDGYSGLFNKLNAHHVTINGMTLEAVGDNTTGYNATFPISNINLTLEQFYAGIGPTKYTVVSNNSTYTLYNYVFVIYDNQAPSTNDSLSLFMYESRLLGMGFSDYNIQIYGNYIITQARAPLNVCLNNMESWGFMDYQANPVQ